MLKVISLDLDGTLFPNNIDDRLWFELIPRELAKAKKMSMNKAVSYAKSEYDKIGIHDPRWYIPEYWLDRFGLKIDIRMLLDKMDYKRYLYQDLSLLKAYDLKMVITTTNARSILDKKLVAIKEFVDVHDTFSVTSDFNKVAKDIDFYKHICKRLGIEAYEVLHIGDNIVYDLLNARAAGLQSILIDRSSKVACYDVIHSLSELVINDKV